MPKKKESRRKRTVGWTVPIKVGQVRIPIHGKTRKSAMAKANAFKRHHLKNVMKPTVKAGHKTRGKPRFRVCPGCGKKKRIAGGFTYCGTCQPRVKKNFSHRYKANWVYKLRGDASGWLPGEYRSWISAKLAARKEAKRLGDKIRVVRGARN